MSFPDYPKQLKKVAEHLNKYEYINVLQAQRMMIAGSTLAGCIHRLRKEGWEIDTLPVDDSPIVNYHLISIPIEVKHE